MEAKERPLTFITLEGKFIVPFFQRTYVWNDSNWDELTAELEDHTRKNNFLGAIILKQLKVSTGETKKLEIIDGQQRLTTLTILLRVLFDCLSSEDQKSVQERIFSILFYKKDVFGNEEVRIEHSNIDVNAYQNVIKHENINLEAINKNSQRVLYCYKYFYEKYMTFDKEKLKSLLNRILNNENKMLVIIDLQENDDEQSIFDTLNTAGVRLTSAEIIKNDIYKRFIELSSREKAIQHYHDVWKKEFIMDEETDDYWQSERKTGRIMRNNIEILLHSFAVIKGFYDPDMHTLIDLSKVYKDKLKNINNENELIILIKEIVKCASVYRDKIITFKNDYLLSYDDSINRILHILEVLEISTFYPYILHLIMKHDNEQEQITLNLEQLEKYVVRNMLSKSQEVKNYNKLCKQFINNEKSLENSYNKNRFDIEVENGLKNISNKEATLVLFWIELYRRFRRSHDDLKELKYDYSLEHIMPQKWEDHWGIDVLEHPKKNIISTEEQKNDRADKIYWIGNMTLLKSTLNSALRNYEYERKMNGDGRKKGIKTYADLSITKDDLVEKFNQGDKIWNEDKIIERTGMLLNQIKEIWG